MPMKRNNEAEDKTGRDDRIWREIVEKDNADALGELFDLYARELLTYGYRLHEDLPAIKDLVQDVFIDIWNYRRGLSGVVKVKFYLYQCLRNALFKQLAKDKKSVTEGWESVARMDWEESPEGRLLRLESEMAQEQRLKVSLSTLTPREREIISLKYYSNLKIREIASLLDLKEQTVANTLQNALAKLRRILIVSHFLFFFVL
jgi:RNA polymerase sigma factor (sigma-70 family)